MTLFNGTPKDYAVSLGLATAGRGRMGKDALAAVEKARAEGMTFTEKPTPVREARPKAPAKPVDLSKPAKAEIKIKPEKPAKPTTTHDAKAVRAWAKGQGIPVADRGRVHADVFAAYEAANPNAAKTEIKVTVGKDLRQAAPRTSPEGTRWEGIVNDKVVKVGEATACSRCGVSLGWHTCQTPSVALGSGSLVPVAISR